jgi:hypothetical protein
MPSFGCGYAGYAALRLCALALNPFVPVIHPKMILAAVFSARCGFGRARRRLVLCLPLFWRTRDAVADFSQQLPAADRVAAPAARKIIFGPHLPAG